MTDRLTHPTPVSLSHPPTLRLLRNRSPETRLSTDEAAASEAASPTGYPLLYRMQWVKGMLSR
jgi:hypothetical protein